MRDTSAAAGSRLAVQHVLPRKDVLRAPRSPETCAEEVLITNRPPLQPEADPLHRALPRLVARLQEVRGQHALPGRGLARWRI